MTLDPFTRGWYPQPRYRYIFKLRDGTTHHLNPRDAKRYIDKRAPGLPPEVCWEVRINGMIRVLWSEDIAEWHQEPL